MEAEWIGKSVSIECNNSMGIFQGMIKSINADAIVLTRAFRNGYPMRNEQSVVTLKSADIAEISIINAHTNKNNMYNSEEVEEPDDDGEIEDESEAQSLPSAFSSMPMPQEQQQQPQQQQARLFTRPILSPQEINKVKNELITALAQLPTIQGGLQPNFATLSPHRVAADAAPKDSVAQFFSNMVPPKVELRMGSGGNSAFVPTTTNMTFPNGFVPQENGQMLHNESPYLAQQLLPPAPPAAPPPLRNQHQQGYMQQAPAIQPHLLQQNGHMRMRNGNGSMHAGGNGGGGVGKSRQQQLPLQQQQRRVRRESNMRQTQTFDTPVDDPLLNEDFDFEGNLALFDKQAIWHTLDAEQQNPEAAARQATAKSQTKYRHDENVLESEPLQLRQIHTDFDGSVEFVTDEGLIIPTIPAFVRLKVERTASQGGLSLQRQLDMLARGASDLAISILGGARRLTPNNSHQWPKIVIICERSPDYRACNLGATAGRLLASHGLKVVLYSEENKIIEHNSIEIALFKATGNAIVYSVDNLCQPDLVIVSSTSTKVLSDPVKNWLSENRASILAIDPLPCGLDDINIKYSIVPILPLHGITGNNCGKVYLCNIGLPDRFFMESGVKYKSPFGHKFVIPIHLNT